MAVHIGKLISKKIKEIGMSKSELSRRISVTPQSTHYILAKSSIDTDVLLKISRALDYDFFQHYLGLNPQGKGHETLMNVSSSELKSQIAEIRKEISTMELHNSYLREIVNLLGPNKQVAAHKQNKPIITDPDSYQDLNRRQKNKKIIG
ncbi:MAG: helix-turn-helix domain-containing protein [Bacteroidota bacterium]|nr:helix-turn-helix domain-containing protein [Bacteroidota bacterium]